MSVPRVIFKCPYIKGGAQRAAAHLSNYVRYMATREGAQRIAPGKAQLPATPKQRNMVEQLLRDFPLSRRLFEYEDYLTNPTRGNASEFITRALEDNYDQIAKRENYVSYIASRPRAQRTGAHALFTGTDDTLALSQIADTVAHHPGNVWLPIISLRREDAARLGYDDAESWKELLSSFAVDMATAMKIPWEQFRWYAAFHDEAHHPHVHMVCYSADGKSGFLTKDGIAQIKSGLAKQIFRQELHEIYEQQTQQRDALIQESGSIMQQLIEQMQTGTMENPRIEQLMAELSQRLKSTSGKKQYGYLKAPLKSVVDEIVDELAKDSRVATAYELWYELREEVLKTYKDDLPERLPLSQQKEFKRIKNLVIEEALRLNEHTAVFSPSDSKDIPDQQEPPVEDVTTNAEPDESLIESDAGITDISEDNNIPLPTMEWSDRYRQARQFLFGGDECPQDFDQAFDLFKVEAQSGNALAMHDLGWMFMDGLGREINETQAREWYAKALNALLAVEAAKPSRYVEYRIGKMYAAGLGTEQDYAAAADWLSKSADQNYKYAQYSLAGLYYRGQGVEKDALQAAAWFQKAAEQGNDFAAYALGKLLLDGGDGLSRNVHSAIGWLKRSAEAGNQYAQYRLGKLLLQGEDVPKNVAEAVRQLTVSAEQGNQYAQYALGKLYLLGKDVPADHDAAVRWLTLSAAQGNEYARYFLDRMNDLQEPSAFSCATQLLHHMGRIFQEQPPRAPIRAVSFTDKKLRQQIREKKIAMGHKADDHEDENIRLQ